MRSGQWASFWSVRIARASRFGGRSFSATVLKAALRRPHVSLPWNFLASAAVGVWLMLAPAVFGTTNSAADADHLLGALIVTGSATLSAEVARPFRRLNSLLGLAVAVSPFFTSGSTGLSIFDDVLVGLLVIALNLPRGKITEHYGLWDRYLGLRGRAAVRPRQRAA